MSQFNYTPISNGTTGDVSQLNNPFAAVATVINGGVDSTNITPASLPASVMQDAANPEKRYKKGFANFVVSGLVLPTSGSLSSTIASGEAFVNGKDVSPSASPQTFTASKDTYVDLKDDGTYVLTAVANGATSGFPLATNSDGSNALRIAKVVTSGSAVTSVPQFAIDALGNYIYNQDPTASPVTIYTNPGTAGGTNSFFYGRENGKKYFRGVTAAINATGSGFQSVAAGLTFPAGFFNVIHSVELTTGVAVNTQYLGAAVNTISTSVLTIYLLQFSGTNGGAPVYVDVRGM